MVRPMSLPCPCCALCIFHMCGLLLPASSHMPGMLACLQRQEKRCGVWGGNAVPCQLVCVILLTVVHCEVDLIAQKEPLLARTCWRPSLLPFPACQAAGDVVLPRH